MNENLLKTFLNRTVKVVFQDGDQLSTKKGKVLEVSEDFILLRTYYRNYAIKVDKIIAIKELEGVNDVGS